MRDYLRPGPEEHDQGEPDSGATGDKMLFVILKGTKSQIAGQIIQLRRSAA